MYTYQCKKQCTGFFCLEHLTTSSSRGGPGAVQFGNSPT